MNKIFSCVLVCILFLAEASAITFTDLQNYFYAYSAQAMQMAQKHKIATTILAAGLGLLVAYKPLQLMCKAHRVKNYNPNNPDKIIATISRRPYHISRTTTILEFPVQKEEYVTRSIMGIIIFEHNQFVEKKMFNAENINYVLNYRKENLQFEKNNSFLGKMLTILHLL